MEIRTNVLSFDIPNLCKSRRNGAFQQALAELEEEGGVAARYQRYKENQRILREGMERLRYHTLLPQELQSPIITSFLYPTENFDFKSFYTAMKE